MPLDWTQVINRYGTGAVIPTAAGGRTFQIVSADEKCVRIRTPLWEDSLAREHLERAVELIEAGKLSRTTGPFVEEYRVLVAGKRPTSVAHILKDLGYLH
ncbi:hypothetical protein C3Y87_13270 [Carbonactinospora thermoautotrophica]|uniref:hypothetical protein n=1 Tax=Carbonactinospora thermoautotrophica TaxID=1469144 RepID=UPI0022722D81|nr:hypothetical protein [Carbonactinospora thermoautotrophica]MCX9192362.1 hypothetical protein [Carbonactinospora thermoautotrophica]